MITTTEIQRIFSEQLNKISDPALCQQIVEVWVEGCRLGNWNSLEELENMPFTLLTNTKGINFIQHTIAVTEGALALAQAQMNVYARMPYQINLDHLVAGGLLHDVGKLLEVEKDGAGGYRKSMNGKLMRHPISGAILAAKAGVSEEIVHIIACHAAEGEGNPQVIETILIHQADFATFNPLVMMANSKLITLEVTSV